MVAVLQRGHWMPIFHKVVGFFRVFLIWSQWSCKTTPLLPCQNSSVHSDSFQCISLYMLMITAHPTSLFCGVTVVLSTKNRKRRLQFSQAHKNLTLEDWKNVAWSDEFRFLLRHSDVRVRIWRKEHESVDPSCLVSTVQAGGGGVMVWGIFSWHTLGPLVPIEHLLNATAYLSIVADHVHPFMTIVYPSSDGYFQKDNTPCNKAQIISDWFL